MKLIIHTESYAQAALLLYLKSNNSDFLRYINENKDSFEDVQKEAENK